MTGPPGSTYVQNPPYYLAQPGTTTPTVQDVTDARILGLFADSITTDHISPAGNIKVKSPAGAYLNSKQVGAQDFNSYGARRGNHEVMMRGTFANIRIKNQMLKGIEGGLTKLQPEGTEMPIYDAAMEYKRRGTPLVICAGNTAPAQAATGRRKARCCLASRPSLPRASSASIVRDLAGMGVALPQFIGDMKLAIELGLDGLETVSIEGLCPCEAAHQGEGAGHRLQGRGRRSRRSSFPCRIDTQDEVESITKTAASCPTSCGTSRLSFWKTQRKGGALRSALFCCFTAS